MPRRPNRRWAHSKAASGDGVSRPWSRAGSATGTGSFRSSLSPRRAEDRVHDERDREPAQRRAQEHPEQRAFPERRGRHETHLAGLAPSHGEVEESPGRLGGGQGTIRDSVRRSIQAGGLTNGNSSHTKFLTPPFPIWRPLIGRILHPRNHPRTKFLAVWIVPRHTRSGDPSCGG